MAPTLLSLPSEIRLLIYEYLRDDVVFKKKRSETTTTGWGIMTGRPELDLQAIRIQGAPTNLIRTCSFVHDEYMRQSPKQAATLIFDCTGFVPHFHKFRFKELSKSTAEFIGMTEALLNKLYRLQVVHIEIFVQRCDASVQLWEIERLLLCFPALSQVSINSICEWYFFEQWQNTRIDDPDPYSSPTHQLIPWSSELEGLPEERLDTLLSSLSLKYHLSISCGFAQFWGESSANRRQWKRQRRGEDVPNPIGADWPRLVVWATKITAPTYPWNVFPFEGLELVRPEYGWNPEPYLLRTKVVQKPGV